MKKSTTELPNDRLILQCIYDLYRDDPMGPLPWDESASAPIYKQVDAGRIAKALNADPGITFGRLYYHLDYKYRYKQWDDSEVHLFAFKVGDKLHCVNFPLLSAILSEKQTDYVRAVALMVLSGLSVLISLSSLAISLLARH